MDGYAGKGHQVLLIDDDSEFCELMTDYLDVHSFAVSSVHTGTAGIEAARRQEYDVILLDMLLPDISGIEVLRHLRTETRAPVVILSAHNEETDRIVTLELGADDYVPKTFSAREHTPSHPAGNTLFPAAEDAPPRSGTRCLPALSGARSAPRNAPAAFPKRRPQARAPRSRPGGTGWSWARAFPSGL